MKMGVPPVVALVGDGRISAGFSREGKMVTFFYPTVGAYDCIPYYTHRNPDEPRYGAQEHFGAFFGLAHFTQETVYDPLDIAHVNPRAVEAAYVEWLERPREITHDWDCPPHGIPRVGGNNVKSHRIQKRQTVVT